MSEKQAEFFALIHGFKQASAARGYRRLLKRGLKPHEALDKLQEAILRKLNKCWECQQPFGPDDTAIYRVDGLWHSPCWEKHRKEIWDAIEQGAEGKPNRERS